MLDYARSPVKALEAQSRGFAHGHDKRHSEPRVTAIDLTQLFLGSATQGAGASEHTGHGDAELQVWVAKHQREHLRGAATKQYDSAVRVGEATWMRRLARCIDRGREETVSARRGHGSRGTPRLPNVDVAPAADPVQAVRERNHAASKGMASRPAYRAKPLIGAPAARFPSYLQESQLDRCPDLGGNGHGAATLDPGASEHAPVCDTGWIDAASVYIADGARRVHTFSQIRGHDERPPRWFLTFYFMPSSSQEILKILHISTLQPLEST